MKTNIKGTIDICTRETIVRSICNTIGYSGYLSIYCRFIVLPKNRPDMIRIQSWAQIGPKITPDNISKYINAL